jgi:outer membrane translocation and assembly module TamA
LRHFGQTDDADPNSVRFVGGIGPRVDLPVGPLRFDISWRVRPTAWKPKFQFAIGPSF